MALNRKFIIKLRSVTCHMELRSVTGTGEHSPRFNRG